MDQTEQYLNDLKSSDPKIREQATQSLWTLWYREAGEEAEQKIKRGMVWMSRGNFPEAEKVFLHLIQNHPDFPEAHNKLATLLYLQGNYHDSVTACRLTLKLNPNHFGAWNGMGMCLYKLARFEEAVKSFEKALQIQPYADVNRVYIARCRSKLN